MKKKTTSFHRYSEEKRRVSIDRSLPNTGAKKGGASLAVAAEEKRWLINSKTVKDKYLLGTALDPTAFSNNPDKPRHQRYHVDNENSEATTQEINGNQKEFLTVIKSEKAKFTHIDVHFTHGGEKTASLERAAKRNEYETRSALKLVR